MNENNPPSTPPESPSSPAPSSPDQTPPPAADLVAHGEIQSERERQLLANLASERQAREQAETARRKAETDAAYAQDEARRLKDIHLASGAAKPKAKRVAVGFWEVEED